MSNQEYVQKELPEKESTMLTQSPRLNMLVICQRYPPVIGGAEYVAYKLSTKLVNQYSYNVRVLATDSTGAFPKKVVQQGVEVYRYRSIAPNELFFFSPQLVPAIASEKVDLIHLHVYHSFPALACRLAKNVTSKFPPVVFTPHFHPESTTNLRNTFRIIYDNIFFNQIFSMCRSIIVVSEYEKKLLSKLIPPEKIEVIPNGVDFGEFKQADANAVLSYYKLHGYTIILYAGYLAKYKGVQFLIKAFKKMISSVDKAKIKLIIAGDGPAKGEFMSLVDDLKLNEHVLFTGYVQRKLVLSLIMACDVFVLPSSYEAFSIVTCEAMACNKAVIATNVGGVPELGIDPNYLLPFGDISSLADRLQNLVTDPDLRKKIGVKNRTNAERFTWSTSVKRHVDLYNRIVRDR